MNESPRRLPGGLRLLVEQALELLKELRNPRVADEEVLLFHLDDLKARVSDALSVARGSELARQQEILRPLRAADGILLHLTDLSQRDTRGRLRDVEALLREVIG